MTKENLPEETGNFTYELRKNRLHMRYKNVSKWRSMSRFSKKLGFSGIIPRGSSLHAFLLKQLRAITRGIFLKKLR